MTDKDNDMSDRPATPNPGSSKARDAGCLCPMMDNEYGNGWGVTTDGTPTFVIRVDCPLHGDNKDSNAD